MNTEIKNTLFRFVTMRAPELSDEKNKNKRFIYRDPKAHRSLFDHAIENRANDVTNWQAMQNAALTFTPLTEETLKDNVNATFIDAAIWIARNKHSFTTKELLEKLEDLPGVLDKETLTLLWDNLFYQVVTQKDFYVKELIMQLLIANHAQQNRNLIDTELQLILARNVENPVVETELIKNIVNAKVVLPKELFVDEKQTALVSERVALKGDELSNEVFATLPSNEMSQAIARSEAQVNIEKHLKLKKELEKLEKSHQKEYQEAYDEAMAVYQAEIDPILEKYNRDIEENKARWCSIRDPKIPYDANDPCNQPTAVVQPKLPEFKFEFRNELDLDYLQSKLTDESFMTFLDVLEIESEETLEESDKKLNVRTSKLENLSYAFDSSTSGFSSAFSLINNAISQNSQIIINNTQSQNTTSVSIGGVVVPTVASRFSAPFEYQVCSKRYRKRINIFLYRNYVDFDMTLDLPDNTWQISGVETTVINGSTPSSSSIFNQVRTGNSVSLNGLFHEKELPYTTFLNGITNLTIKITFSNGAVKSFTSGFWNTVSCFSGILNNIKDPIGTSTGSSGDTGSSGTGSSNPPKVDNNFIPTGFGVKQLGIADYKKVEQTVQGYVEGDVAHIENIMAREYKEKATRKLRRSENTTTTSSETEREKLSDTTSTNRFEMQSEVAKVLQEGKDFSAGAGISYTGIPETTLTANVNFAAHSSKEESTRQAITQAKDVTERAMDRIVTKVKEERITKIIEEFEENNKHGFDNTKGDKHVVGVFRWVDKIYKNQILNFGKRLMFEFMVPEPAKLHLLGMTENKGLTSLVKPIDPRKFEDPAGSTILLRLKDYSSINENTIKYWAGMFNVELDKMPEEFVYSNKTFASSKTGGNECYEDKSDIKIPEGYEAISAKLKLSARWDHDGGQAHSVNISFGNQNLYVQGKKADLTENDLVGKQSEYTLDNYVENMTVSYSVLNYLAFSIGLSVKSKLQSQVKIKWQQETFKAIIDAYQNALIEYNQKLSEEDAVGIKIKGENPGFYRQIENMILRKNCISYIIDQNEAAKRTYGKDMFKPLLPGVERSFSNHEVNVGPALDDYAAFTKFIEQAFEWEIMSYNFYPYYWGVKKDWAQLYQYDNNDPLFRNFMQAGMARVIVTVRPGFEEAVNYYMQTGQIWNGGEVPVIEDKLFMSIVDELRQIPGKKEGKAWVTRLPTALTILQADSIGLKVTKALPFDDDLSDFEDPSIVPVSEGLDISYAELGSSQTAKIAGKIFGNENKEAKILLKNLDGTTRDITYCDANGNWELNTISVGKYQLLLDANNDFPNTNYEVTEGSKEQTVELSGGQLLEINLTVQPLD